MPQEAKRCYEFSSFRLDAARRVLFMQGTPLLLPPKVFNTLLVLVERRGQVVEKDELMKLLWPDSFVEEANLTQNVSLLRKLLGEVPNDHRYIVTVPGRGYRFVAEVAESGNEETDLIVKERTRSPIVITQEGKLGPPSEEEKVPFATQEKLSTPGGSSASVGGSSRRRAPLLSRKAIALAALLTTVLGGVLLSIWLFRGGLPAHQVEIKSLAVLPLENLSGDPDYFADGMTEALITDLAKIGALRVISRQSVMKYKGTRQSTSDIAQELKVDAVVLGSVLRGDDKVRITIQLIHPATDRHLWSESYERDLRDILTLQREVTRAIAGEIRIKLSESEQTHLAKALQVNPEAYLYYLRGKALDVRNNKADNEAAIESLERAVNIDPHFAAAHARLAVAYVDRFFFFVSEDRKEWEGKAYDAVEKALSLDADSADAYVAKGRLLWTPSNGFPHEEAIKELRRAIALNPSSDDARGELAMILNHIGLNDEALREAQTAEAINPSAKRPLFQMGYALLWQGKYEQALPVLLSIPREFNPGSAGSFIAWALFQMGGRDKAQAKLEEYLKEYPQDTGGRFAAVQALVFAAAGEEDKALEKIQGATRKKDFGHFHHTAHFIASAYARMNKPEEAVYWLQQAAETGFPCYPLFEQDTNLNPVRTDPRFRHFMGKLKAQWENYKAIL